MPEELPIHIPMVCFRHGTVYFTKFMTTTHKDYYYGCKYFREGCKTFFTLPREEQVYGQSRSTD